MGQRPNQRRTIGLKLRTWLGSSTKMVRFKNRYFLISVQTHSRTDLSEWNEKHLNNAIRDSIQLNFGDFGSSAVSQSLQGIYPFGGCWLSVSAVKYFNPYTGIGIVRASRDFYRMVWASFTLINTIQAVSIAINAIHVSGMTIFEII